MNHTTFRKLSRQEKELIRSRFSTNNRVLMILATLLTVVSAYSIFWKQSATWDEISLFIKFVFSILLFLFWIILFKIFSFLGELSLRIDLFRGKVRQVISSVTDFYFDELSFKITLEQKEIVVQFNKGLTTLNIDKKSYIENEDCRNDFDIQFNSEQKFLVCFLPISRVVISLQSFDL